MRILFDSRKKEYKEVFGCLTPGQACPIHIHIPETVKTNQVLCVVNYQDGSLCKQIPLTFDYKDGPYEIFSGDLVLDVPELYFYYFRITGHTGTFRLFRQGYDTNMEDGDCWQVTCAPATFTTPDWAKGKLIYQIFPDRFCKEGDCDLTNKLQPYEVHQNWAEEVHWQPTEKGEVLNNDFFGGNFRGIEKKLPYLADMGVEILYLNPISKSFSSHRYDTGDYKTPDPMLGTLENFSALCEAAHKLGIRVILDGVYSHTGADSLYFNKYGNFPGLGAYQSPDSAYHSWYTFHQYPDKYLSWWDFDTLPTVKKMDPAFLDYIITGEDSVIAHWLSAGADGFRLDVADELPNAFMDLFKKQVRKLRPDALVMGEVWEDASNKVAYNVRCRYFVDGTLDSVMNYPFRKAILDFATGADDGKGVIWQLETILENYPEQVIHCNMNLLGTHDTPRILSVLSGDFEGDRQTLSKKKLTDEQYERASARLKMATALQYALPGCPSLYYGDEAGMEGGKDPFNRRTFPWGKEDAQLQAHFRKLGQLRKALKAWQLGDTAFACPAPGCLQVTRTLDGQKVHLYLNRRDVVWCIPAGKVHLAENTRQFTIGSYGWAIVEE